jgi:hypothetical protein
MAPNAGLAAEPTADAAPKAGAEGFPKPVIPAPTGEAVPKAGAEGFPKLLAPNVDAEVAPNVGVEVAPNVGAEVAPNVLAGCVGCPNAGPGVDDGWFAVGTENVG